MTINRNQYFTIGLVLLFLGIQFRTVQAYVLNEETTKVLNKEPQPEQSTGFLSPLFGAPEPAPRRTINPPRWLGWSLLSIGGVLILHSLAMRKPG